MIYIARYFPEKVDLSAGWDSPHWRAAQIAAISNFLPQSAPTCRPEIAAKLAFSDMGLHGIFRVKRELARCTRTHCSQEIWKDSCAEFFVQPGPETGYFNFEFNCGGAFLCSHVSDSTRTAQGGLAKASPISEDSLRVVTVRTSMPRIVDPELKETTDWTLNFYIPFSIFTSYVGEQRARPGDTWKCNFYKCAEDVSHPHWAAWAPVDEFNFHLPRCFGTLRFEK